MILVMFQAPAVDLREAETKGEASRPAVAAEVTSSVCDVIRLGEQVRSCTPGGLAQPHGTRPCVITFADPWRAEDCVFNCASVRSLRVFFLKFLGRQGPSDITFKIIH